MKRATKAEVSYPPGWFSEPVKAWPGLCDYEPQLHKLLMKSGWGTAARSQHASETRTRALESPNAWVAESARGTIPGLAKALFDNQKRKPATGKMGAALVNGNPCRKCGGTLRYLVGGRCQRCALATRSSRT